jgi:hypothetical protein
MLLNILKTKQNIQIIYNTFTKRSYYQLHSTYFRPHLFLLRMRIQLIKVQANHLSYIYQHLKDGK